MASETGLNTSRYKSFAELKAYHPSLPDGEYTLYPHGDDTPVKTYCMSIGDDHYQAVWSQIGGPEGTTLWESNVSNATLHGSSGSYDNIVTPYEKGGSPGSKVNVAAMDFWGNQDNVVWCKRTRTYDSNGDATTDTSWNENIYLTLHDTVTWHNIWDTAASTQLDGYVSMSYATNDTNTPTAHGVTRYTAFYGNASSTRGFANAQNGDDSGIPSGEPVMGSWKARHVISYVHNSSGYNATRCQGDCWTGKEDAAMEQIWFVKFRNE